MDTLNLQLTLPQRSFPPVAVRSIMVPLIDGYATILPLHTKFLSVLGTGIVTVEEATSGAKQSFFVSGGFVEVNQDQVNILADVSEQASTIDKGRAMEAKRRAEQLLKVQKADTDIVRAQAALLRASSRLAAAELVQ